MTRWADDTLLLVCSRLAHGDEGAPGQPYVEPDGAAAAFDGVVFNLGELQGEVGRPGASEVEVLLAGLCEHGPGFLRRVDGQFALVARCSAGGPVLLARDRFGIAPLYWAPTATGVAAGSNLPAVPALRGDPRSGTGTRFDHDGLVSILADWAPTGSLTPYAGVHQVRPGHIVTVATDAGTPRVVSDERWAPTPVSALKPSASASPSEDEIVQLEAAVRESVRARMRSTGRVACLLSGGIDSTIIGAIARDEGASLGLALALEGDDLVAGRQREVAEALGIDLVQHQLVPREVVDTFEAYVRTRRMPLVRLGPVGMTALARRARAEGISGVLSGEGADELFAGYDSYRILAAREGRFGDPRRLPWAQFGVPEFGAGRGAVWARSYWRGLVSFSASAGSRRLDILRPVNDLLRSPLRDAVLGAAPTRPDEHSPAADPLEARRQVDLAHLLGGYLLTVQGDHAWMEERVELRPPYLASPVADWALSRDVREFVRISEGKTPIRALLPRLAQQRPALAGLGFAKAAFRVDVAFVVREPEQFDRLAGFALGCPDDLVDRAALRTRIDAIRAAGTCSEAESELLTFAASLGVLGQG
ncbi:asparagine synthetase B family protein [Mobilicoccus massiliensis]|uniref:asparagine synthetase B family protein n=1 Tax=Mobilicoccus massiliensis TaxID=1522310 RepID=UPI00058B3924|nr:asparagine synthase-related protein [Mobilicoccus massiliensis]